MLWYRTRERPEGLLTLFFLGQTVGIPLRLHLLQTPHADPVVGHLLGIVSLTGLLLAAACLVIALGASLRLSGAQVHFEAGPLSFAVGQDSSAVERLIAESDARHRAELRELKTSLTSVAQGPEVLSRVQQMIRTSESRQLEMLDAAWEDFTVRTETQRRLDLARVSAGLTYLDRRTGEHAELLGFVLDNTRER